AMFRASAFQEAGGFRPDVIAGEEPELCVRLRDSGWKIWRLADPMALHDAAMTRFGQWWKRMVRGGYAFAQGAAMHGRGPSRHWVKERRSILFWGLLVPLAALVAALVVGPWGLAILLAYPLQVLRLALRSHLAPGKGKWAYPLFLMLGKFPQMQGLLRYQVQTIRRRQAAIIEYK
ncbi:glycosyltransferase family 2 protein, partial [Nostoc sp. NIES-2111]